VGLRGPGCRRAVLGALRLGSIPGGGTKL